MSYSASLLGVPPQSSLSSQSTNYTNHMIQSIFSYKGNIMLAAIISLLLVILFVLLLHVYAKWFLERSRNRRRRATRRRRTSSLIVSDSNTTITRHSNALFTFDTESSKGVDPSVIALIPLFVYEGRSYENGLECVICLSSFEEREVGRSLPKCGHGFHAECIDTWLFSHVSCPICRTPVLCDKKVEEAHVICLQDQVVSNEVVESQGNDPSEVGSGNREDDNSLEIITVDHAQEFVDENANASANNGESSSSSLSSSSNSSLGCSYSCSSVKRMLSKSRSERKVYPNFSEVEA